MTFSLNFVEFRLRPICLLVAFMLLPARASAALELFRVDPTTTVLTLQGTTHAEPWQEQGTDSLTTSYKGWLVIDFQASSVQFVTGSSLVAAQTNGWQPGPQGSVTATLANYGAKATIGSGIGEDHVLTAIRNLNFAIASPPLMTGNGPIDASKVSLAIPQGVNSVLDYRANGLVVLGGQRILDGLSASNAGGEVTISFVAEVQTITVPIDVTFTCQVLSSNDTTLQFSGMVTARRSVMILNHQLLWLPSPTNRLEFTLIWDRPLKLQKATTLNPPDWTDFSTDAPAVIIADGPSGFFRASGP